MLCPDCGGRCDSRGLCPQCESRAWEHVRKYGYAVQRITRWRICRDGFIRCGNYNLYVVKKLPKGYARSRIRYIDMLDVVFVEATKSSLGFLEIRTRNQTYPATSSVQQARYSPLALCFPRWKNRIMRKIYAWVRQSRRELLFQMRTQHSPREYCLNCGSRDLTNIWRTAPHPHPDRNAYRCKVCRNEWKII